MGNMHDFTNGAVVWNKGYAFPNPLTEQDLRERAPSIFAAHAQEDVSGRYLFMPTFEILERVMRETSLVPIRAREIICRNDANREYAKHEIVLRQSEPDREWRVGDCLFEVRMTNSHNRASGYRIDPGLMRFACSNALMVCDSAYPGVSVRHTGDQEMLRNVIEGTCEVVHDSLKVQDRIEDMRAVTLDVPEQHAFAKAAAVVRWGEDPVIDPVRLLKARRSEDQKDDVFTVFNRVQENVIKGRQFGGLSDKGRRITTRKVSSINEDQRINKALWTLTQEMLKLKAAA